MKIVATSDTHFPLDIKDLSMFPKGDVLIHCGDIMFTGEAGEWDSLAKSMYALQYQNKFLVPGNHDRYIEEYGQLSTNEMYVLGGNTDIVLPREPFRVLPNGMRALFIPYVTGLPGWAFNEEEQWILKWIMGWTNNGKFVPDIVCSHAPMADVLDACDPEELEYKDQDHVGSIAVRLWFNSLKIKPKLFICGHIHESYGSTELDGCRVFNVSMCDGEYNKVNPPVVIEV